MLAPSASRPSPAPTLRERFALARAGDPMEFEQALLRITIDSVIVAYFLVVFLSDRVLSDRELRVLALLGGGSLTLALGYFAALLASPGVSHRRRSFGVMRDMAVLTTALLVGEGAGAVFAGLFVWIPIGNGFRFGRAYLHFAQALALVSLTVILFVSPFWRDHFTVGLAFVIATIAIPWYVSLLIARLQAANRRTEEARGEAEAANVAKTRFLAATSHDLRQPMQALSMYASVLEQRVADADARRIVHGVQLSVTTLERMFDSLLDIAKIESGVVKPNAVVFPLMPLLEHVVEGERAIAVQKGLELRVCRTSASVRSDPALLERMLKNLVTNALRYTERGRILVGCRRVGASGVRLDVVDSGIGIALEEQERIFEEYYQLSGNSAQGLGLGLPIVRSLGELLGHRVSVRSAVGRGSVFSIDLPRVADVPARVALAAPAASLARLNVALVDDDVEIRRSMALLLESWGCRTVAAGTADEIEKALGAQAVVPDALIVDYRLAGTMTGLQVMERLRERFGRELPTLVISGTANPSQLQARAPGVPFAMKPVAPGKLRAFLSRALQHG